MNFRSLRVINEDFIAPGQGFGTHPHENMEILTYVISGQLEHRDNLGNGTVINAGEFQRMSAGEGITHSEYNPSSTVPTHLYQIWILPKLIGGTPSYQQKKFDDALFHNKLHLVVSEDGQSESLSINKDLRVYFGRFDEGSSFNLPLEQSRGGWLQIVKGAARLGEYTLGVGDGVALENESTLSLEALEKLELLYFDLP